jgi:lipoprotein-anchoring transpeptidase ErfK/SrfK
MTRRRTAAALVAIACAGASVLVLRGGDEPERRPAPRGKASGASSQPAGEPARGPYGARFMRRTQLRSRPAGPVVRSLGPHTGYGSDRVLAVVQRSGRWLGVLSDHLPNSRVGWIPVENVTLLHVPYTLHVDLSERKLVVRRKGRAVRRITVAIGRSGSTTPTGRFAVTDRLKIDGDHPAYGCCALALTGRQPNVPQGWTGGDRLAIHGTTNEATLGTPASSGCLRASDRNMRWLLKRISLGTPVRIRV